MGNNVSNSAPVSPILYQTVQHILTTELYEAASNGVRTVRASHIEHSIVGWSHNYSNY